MRTRLVSDPVRGGDLQLVARETLTGPDAPIVIYGPDQKPLLLAQGDTPRTPSPVAPLVPYLPPDAPPRAKIDSPGYNVTLTPRAEYSFLPSFPQLRALSENCDVLRIVIEDVKEQLVGMDFEIRDIVGEDKKGKAKAPSQSTGAARKDVRKRLEYPDGQRDFRTWLRLLLEEKMVSDAAAVYRWRTLQGDPWALMIVDGATIKPLANRIGMLPPPPAPAFQQIVYGRVETQFQQPWRTPDPKAPDGSRKFELFYRPGTPRTYVPYGMSVVERVMLSVNLALRRDTYYMAYYTDGNIPQSFWSCPDEWSPATIKEMQTVFDAFLTGKTEERARLIFMPGSKGGLQTPRAHDEWKYEFDEFIARKICAAFGMSPIAFVRVMNRATAEQADASETDSGLRPLMKWVADFINENIRDFYGFEGVEFAWTEEKEADERLTYETHVAYVNAGILTPDEVREELGREPLPEPELPEALPPGAAAAAGAGAPPGSAPGAAPAAKGKDAPPGKEKASADDEEEPQRAVRDELRRWRKVALKDPARRFVSSIIPERLAQTVRAWLQHDSDPEAIAWAMRAAGRKGGGQSIRLRMKLERRTRAAAWRHYRTHQQAIKDTAEQLRSEGKHQPADPHAHDPLIAAFDEPAFREAMTTPLEDGFAAASRAAHRIAAQAQRAAMRAYDFEAHDAAAEDYAQLRAAELVGMKRLEDGSLAPNPNSKWRVARTVRDAIAVKINEALQDGRDASWLADEIEKAGLAYWRAEAIGRTETSFAMSAGTVFSYREADVERVEILDGFGCLRDGHDDDEPGVDGEIWTLEEYEEYPIGHTNCRRDAAPAPEAA